MTGRTRAVGLLVGLMGGFVSGLLGVGGGIVMVPGLVLAMSIAQHRAHATSLAAILPLGVTGAAIYALEGGKLHLGYAAALSAGAIVGALVGTSALARVPERILKALFILALMIAGIRLVLA